MSGSVEEVLDRTPYDDRTLSGLLRRGVGARPDHVVCTVGGEERTWEALDEAARRLAGALAALGVTHGSVVLHMAANSVRHVEVLFALGLLGAIECPVNTRLRGEPLRHVLAHSGAEVMLVDEHLLAEVDPVLPPALRALIVEGAPTPVPGVEVLGGGDLPSGSLPPVKSAPTDPAMLLYTSGTTGPAKGVVLPQHFTFSAAAVKTAAWGLDEHDVLYSPLPLFHSNARFSTLLTACVLGARAVIAERFSATSFWQDVAACGATEVGVVGTVPGILLSRPPADSDRAHMVRQIHGAGALSIEQRRAFEERFGTRLVVGFAMTETSHIATTGPLDPGRYRGAGRPVDGFDVAILDARDRRLPAGEVGEIAVRPQLPGAMFTGYHRQPEATLEAFSNLWFHTGDLGSIDTDGYLHWVDRAKDAIRRKGEMISSRDVEAVALSFPGVDEAAAVGIPAPLGEEDVLLCVEAAAGVTVDTDALLRHCAERLPSFAVPSHVRVLDELPRNATHKITKLELRERWVRKEVPG